MPLKQTNFLLNFVYMASGDLKTAAGDLKRRHFGPDIMQDFFDNLDVCTTWYPSYYIQ